MTKGINKGGAKKASTHPEKLSPTQLKALDLILAGMPLQDVAEKVGRARQTVSDWKNQHPLFKAKLDELRGEAEEELHYALPMIERFMMEQLRRLAQDAPPEMQLKVIQYFFSRFGQSERDVDRYSPLLGEGSDMLRRVLSKNHRLEDA